MSTKEVKRALGRRSEMVRRQEFLDGRIRPYLVAQDGANGSWETEVPRYVFHSLSKEQRGSESTDLKSDASVEFYRSEFENVIQDRYGVQEA
jgi:hypothetical protein